MYGKELLLLLYLTLWTQVKLSSQEPASYRLINEEFLYREESVIVPQESFERYAELLNHPLHLNSASPDQLHESGLFSPFQVYSLIKYRENYGMLYSIYELAALTGFRSSMLREIAPFLSLEPGSRAVVQKKNRHMFMFHIGKTFPESQAYKSSLKDEEKAVYSGRPLSTNLRIKSSFGNSLSLGLTYEKDAGEHFYVDHRPEFLSGYLQYSGHRLIKQLVFGTFRLNHGLGLVNGAGFIHSPESFRVNSLSMLRIRPYSSKSESGYERGVGIRMDVKRFKLLGWASYLNLDLSTTGLKKESQNTDWRSYVRNSGLHRTISEMEGRDLAFRFHAGIQGLYSKDHLDAGMAISAESVGIKSSGMPGLNKHLSLHGNWHREGWQFFGEMALRDWNSLAVLAGISYEANDFVHGLLLVHHYGTAYEGSQPSAYASGSKINSEKGLALHLHLEPGRWIKADFTGELFYFPEPRYLTLVPSHGQRYSLSLLNSGTSIFQWRIRMVSKIWQSTPAGNDTGLHPIRTKQVSRFDLRFIYTHVIQWQSRIITSFLSRSESSYPAYAAVQQFSYQSSKFLKPSFQFVVFDVQDWDNRIYIYEPGLYYSFNFPAYYGTGYKTTLALTLKPVQKLSVAGKIACTVYHGRKNLGTGNELIPGNKRWSLELQIRLNL